MKLLLNLATFALLSGHAMAEPPADSKTLFEWSKWCCFDSNERCADACAFINNYDNQAAAAKLSEGMTGELTIFTLEAMGLVAVDGVGPFGEVTIEGVPALCREHTPFRCCDGGDGYACGDPHFKTWGGLDYDYQGACDLKFISAPKYANGLGLDIHIRTDTRFDYSFISAAVIKIGDNTLEVGAWGEYILNGVEGTVQGLDFDAEFPSTMGDNIPLSVEMKSKKTHIFTIDASHVTGDADSKIKIQTFKDWVSIHLDFPQKDDFGDSVGMLGSFPEGVRFARDGVTVMEDDNEFGQEWQVLPEEAGLFEGARFPQHPEKCVLPETLPRSSTNRRLAESAVSEEDARAACNHLEMHQEFCVRDVLATQDLEMAEADAF